MRLLPLLALILFVASCKKATVLPDSIPMGESDAVEITYTGNVIETEFIVNGCPVFQSRHYINECANYPLDIFRYIGFRFEDEDWLYRLGWIRLNLQQDRIELNSWAIQPVE